jgi:hypothetical protein
MTDKPHPGLARPGASNEPDGSADQPRSPATSDGGDRLQEGRA